MPNMLTRREIIEMWSQLSEELLDSYCCPSCRSIMDLCKDGVSYTCPSSECRNYGTMRKYEK